MGKKKKYEAEKECKPNPSALGAALAWQDRRALVFAYWALVLPSICVTVFRINDPGLNVLVQILERLISILFLYAVSSRWSKRLGGTGVRRTAMSMIIILGLGIVTWLPIPLLKVGFASATDAKLRMPLLVLFVPLGFFSYYFYFYFFPAAFNVCSLPKILSISGHYLLQSILLPLKASLAPFGFMLLASSLIIIPSPDASHPVLAFAQTAVHGTYWALSTYLSLGYAFIFLDERFRAEMGADEKMTGRLLNLSKEAPSWLKAMLEPKQGLVMILAGTFVHLGNVSQEANMSPRFRTQLESVEVEDGRVKVLLSIQDNEYHLRGFRPSKLVLAKSNRELISRFPVRVVAKNKPVDIRFPFPSSGSPALLKLEFETGLKKEEMLDIKDLGVWYGTTKIAELHPGPSPKLTVKKWNPSRGPKSV